jgi:hypothetical protein
MQATPGRGADNRLLAAMRMLSWIEDIADKAGH